MRNRSFLFVFFAMILWTGCDDKTFDPVLQSGTSGALTGPAGEIVLELNENNIDEAFGPITWTASDYGFDAAVSYTVEMDLAGAEFVDPTALGTVNTTSLDDVTNGELNNLLLSKGAAGNSVVEVEMRVKSEIADDITPLYSTPFTVSIKTFQAAVEYPKLQVPGDYQDWMPENTETVLRERFGDQVFDGYLYFPNPTTEYKIAQGFSWDTNWGDTGADGTLDPGGDNILASGEGLYRINVNLADLTYTTVKTDWGLIGSATPGGWDADQDMTYDIDKGTWSVTLDLVAGEMKFRANDAWDIDLGDDDTNGAMEYGGANIPVAEDGNYTVELVLNASEYTYNITKN